MRYVSRTLEVVGSLALIAVLTIVLFRGLSGATPTFTSTDRVMLLEHRPGGYFISPDKYERCEAERKVWYHANGAKTNVGTWCWR